jgi:hypothetical protein
MSYHDLHLANVRERLRLRSMRITQEFRAVAESIAT